MRRRNERKNKVVEALGKYGWAIPFCVWQIDEDSRPYCVTVSRLIKAFPFHTDLITNTVVRLAIKADASDPSSRRAPEQVMEKILRIGLVAGCVPKGQNKGLITLGTVRPKTLTDGEAIKRECESDITSTQPQRPEQTFGYLVGTASRAPTVSLSADGQATFEYYYEQCQARQNFGIGPQTLMADGGTSNDIKKKEKKAAAAKKKADA